MTDQALDINLQLRRGAGDFLLDTRLALPASGVTGIFGPSGSGKTTLLRCIAGLESRAEGRVVFKQQSWQDGRQQLPCHRRPIAYVFQEASLFPHLNVAGNLRYARQRARGYGPDMDAVIELLGLSALLPRRPDRLSGGERQRVAIARALLAAPQLLLMDEPLSGLDPRRKADILPYLEALCRDSAIPILYVSHSLDEICRLADHLVLMDAGRAIADGPLADMLISQRQRLGENDEVSAVLNVELQARDEPWMLMKCGFTGGELWVRDSGDPVGSRLRLRIRAQDVSVSTGPPQGSSILNILPCTIAALHEDFSPAMQIVELQLGEARLLARVTRRSVHQLSLRVGMAVYAQLKSVAIIR